MKTSRVVLKAEYNNGSEIYYLEDTWLSTTYILNTDRILTTFNEDQKNGHVRKSQSMQKISRRKYRRILQYLETEFINVEDNSDWADCDFWEVEYYNRNGLVHRFYGITDPGEVPDSFRRFLHSLEPCQERAKSALLYAAIPFILLKEIVSNAIKH